VHGGGDAVAGLADVEELFDVFDGDLDRPAGDVAFDAAFHSYRRISSVPMPSEAGYA